jgi:hypothetical protein
LIFFPFFSCPYFRNEVGGESEKTVALSRGSALKKQPHMQDQMNNCEQASNHTPTAARGFSILDTPDTFWKDGYCPYNISSVAGKNVIERTDDGSTFYKKHFYGQGKTQKNNQFSS